MKIEVAPVSMMACVAAIVIAFAHSALYNGVEQFNAMTVALSSLVDGSTAKESKWSYSVG
jgi:hypothetical protein